MYILDRSELISQLREALHLVESPSTEVAEFEIGDTMFCFEFDSEEEDAT